MLWFCFWFFTGPAVLLALLSLKGERRRARWVEEQLAARNETYLPPVALIVPVKGMDEGLRENLASLAAQDYPDYELIVAARSADDIPAGVLPDRVRVVLAEGRDSAASEKVQNLTAAVHAARKHTAVYCFADSDGRVRPGWLRALVAPLQDEGVGAATGYRWYAPEPPDFWSLLRSVWNAVIAGTLGSGDAAFAWGGATAIRREVFQSARVLEHWKRAISDDYALSAAVHAGGLRIAFVPGAMVASADHIRGLAFLRWARRQMIITRVYNPRQWWPALAAHFWYCGAMAATVAASIAGHRLAEWALLVLLSPGMLKGTNRATLAKAELPDYKRWFDRYGWVHSWWVPLATWIWLGVLAASATTNTIEWRGNRYVVRRHGVQ